jgi:hypothetical protein
VSKDVAADLAERGLEEHERKVICVTPRGSAKALDRLVHDVESIFKLGEAGTEFKGPVITPHRLKSR